MKQLTIYSSLLLLTAGTLRADVLFSDSFNSYLPGNLVGQGAWTQTGTTTTAPIQTTNFAVYLNTTGQDANAGFAGGAITLADGSSIYMGATLSLASAQATGDYFLHFSPAAGNSSLFPSRLYAKALDTGYVLGWVETTGGSAVPSYGTTVLSFNTSYRVVMEYKNIAGALNDVGLLYVSPSDVNVEANNTPYLTKTWTSTLAEGEVFGSVNLRQGTASSAPTVWVDDLNAATTFSEVAVFTPVPEPGTFGLLGLGIAGLLLRRRRN